MATIGDRLRESRIAQGLTIAALATACGISEGMIRQVEGDTIKNPSLVIGLRIARALDVDPYWLATGQEDTLHERLARVETVVAYLEKQVRETRQAR